MEGGNVCTFSFCCYFKRQLLKVAQRRGERLYVNPIKNGNKTLAPSFIFLHIQTSNSAHLSPDYQPAGAIGEVMFSGSNLFFMNRRAL